jgi:Ca2+-binding EF-hand superfamily protein
MAGPSVPGTNAVPVPSQDGVAPTPETDDMDAAPAASAAEGSSAGPSASNADCNGAADISEQIHIDGRNDSSPRGHNEAATKEDGENSAVLSSEHAAQLGADQEAGPNDLSNMDGSSGAEVGVENSIHEASDQFVSNDVDAMRRVVFTPQEELQAPDDAPRTGHQTTAAKTEEPLHGPIAVTLAVVGAQAHVSLLLNVLDARMRSSPSGKGLTPRDRKESQSRLYKPAKPARAKSWRASYSTASTRGPALLPLVERVALLEPGPSMVAAYKVRAAKRAEFTAFAAANGVGPAYHDAKEKSRAKSSRPHAEGTAPQKPSTENKERKSSMSNSNEKTPGTPSARTKTQKKRAPKTSKAPSPSRRGPVTKGGVALTRKERYWNLSYIPKKSDGEASRAKSSSSVMAGGESSSSASGKMDAVGGSIDDTAVNEKVLDPAKARIVVQGQQIRVVIQILEPQKSTAERETFLKNALTEVGLFPSSMLDEKANILRGAMKSVDDTFTAKCSSLAIRMGAIIIEKKFKPKELVNDWDKKMKGFVSKIDFRMGVRSLGFTANNTVVDALFNEYDDDGGGTLDTAELRGALKRMQMAASKISLEAESIEEGHAEVRAKLARIEAAIAATRNVETALVSGETDKVQVLQPSAFEQQESILGEERKQKRAEEEAAAAAEKERAENLEREEAERANAEQAAALAAEEERKRAEEEAAKLESSATLEEQMKKLNKEIASLDPSNQERKLSQMMGAAIVQKNATPMDLVRAWDQKHKGCVNKIEFRQGIRKGLGLKAENRDIDAVFDEFDDDGGGTLDAPELKEALKAMQDAAAEAIAMEATHATKQAEARIRLGRFERVMSVTKDAEQALQGHAQASASGATDQATLADQYTLALDLKRIAVREQLALGVLGVKAS